MPVHIVVGGQYGSEGKGKVTRHFAEKFHAVAAVKVSGTNSGHTVYDKEGNPHILRVLPSPCVNPEMFCVIPAGAVFCPEILFKECEELNFPRSHIYIHPNAGIIGEEERNKERWSPELRDIGSTMSGTGEATMRRIARDGTFTRASGVAELDEFLIDTTALMRSWLDDGWHIMVEGGQGFGLSLTQTRWYPHCTSRDTTAAAFLADAGLAISDVENVIQVLRSYEIRVAGNSGYMAHETTWEQVTKNANSPTPIQELTSVSKKVRRVGYVDMDLIMRATCANRPTITVLNFMDYIGEDILPYGDRRLGPNRYSLIDNIEKQTGCRITHLGFDGTSVVDINDCEVVMV